MKMSCRKAWTALKNIESKLGFPSLNEKSVELPVEGHIKLNKDTI